MICAPYSGAWPIRSLSAFQIVQKPLDALAAVAAGLAVFSDNYSSYRTHYSVCAPTIHHSLFHSYEHQRNSDKSLRDHFRLLLHSMAHCRARAI